MSKIDDITRLRHMIDAARKACQFMQGKTKNDDLPILITQLEAVLASEGIQP